MSCTTSEEDPPIYVEYSVVKSLTLTDNMKRSHFPPIFFCKALFVTGKSSEFVYPATYKCPLLSKAADTGLSLPFPPINVEYNSSLD